MDTITAAFTALIGGASSRLWPLYLPGMLALAWLVYRHEKRSEGFFRWLFPRSIYLHASHLVDLQLFAVNRLVGLLGVFNKVAITTTVTVIIVNCLGGTLATADSLAPLAVAFLVLIANDFSVYWIHRIHHEHPTLWPFHAVHHSAEVMTPITAYRKHPVYDLLGSLVKGVILGTTQGVLLSFFVTEVSGTLLLGTNIFYVVFHSVAANLRHSHVWVSFGPMWEHVFISPAQHQVHHSVDKKHYNKNYGEVLAIWDWMFGTLYVTATKEDLRFGLGDRQGRPMAQPHTSLRQALVLPVRQSFATLRRRRRTSAPTAGVAPSSHPAE